MKIFFAIWTTLISLVAAPVFAQQDNVWLSDIEKAKQIAAAENKLVLLHFWGSFCRPCVNLDKFVFSNPRVTQAITDHFVPVKINVEYNPELAKEYGVDTIPHDVVISPTGRMLTRRKSPDNTDGYIRMVTTAAKTAPARDRIPPQIESNIVAAVPTETQNEKVKMAFVPAGQTEIEQPSLQEINHNSQIALVQASKETPAPVTVDNRHFSDSRRAEVHLNYKSSNRFALPESIQSNQNANIDESKQLVRENSNFEIQRNKGSFPLKAPIASVAPIASGENNKNGVLPIVNDAVANKPASISVNRTEVASQFSRPEISVPNLTASANTAPEFSAPETTALGMRITGNLTKDAISNPDQLSVAQSKNIHKIEAPKIELPKIKVAQQTSGKSNSPEENSFNGVLRPRKLLDEKNTGAAIAGSGKGAQQPGGAKVSSKHQNNVNPPLGMDGHCPVSFYSLGQLAKGDRKWGCVHRGRLYLFASQVCRDQFRLAPDVYSPMLAGYDPVDFGLRGDLTPGKLSHRVVHEVNEQRMVFLFSSEENKNAFSKQPDRYLQTVRQAINDVDKPTILR